MRLFFRIYSFFLVFLLAVSIGRGFMSLWFVKNGFTYPEVSLFYLIDFGIPAVFLLLVKNFSTSKSFAIALISEVLLMLSYYHFYHPLQLYFSAILAGTTVVFFYVTYNTLYFENTSREKRATSSSFFTLAGPFLGIAIPIIGGFIGQRWGISTMFLISIPILLTTLYLIRFLPKIEFKADLAESLAKTRRINILLLIEGIKDTVAFAAIPIFTLFFVREPLLYGIYLSYLAFISTAATIFLGIISDKLKKRKIILYPSTTLVALTIIALGFSNNLTYWAITTGVFGFISTISGTFVVTLILDSVHEVKAAMVGREFLLGVGRIIGMLIIFTSLALFRSANLALIFIGILYLSVPILVRLQKIY